MVQIIQPEVALNAAIFAAFFAMIATELMAASAIIFKYEESTKKVFRFLVPIWEITGTFFVFYAVNVEALVPDALPLIAYAYISYILIFLILYVGRNASIIAAEYIWKNRVVNRKLLYRVYALITYVLGILILVIYTSILSGVGVNFADKSFDLLKFVSFLPDDGFIVGSAILLFGLGAVFYDLEVNRSLPLAVTAIGMIIAGTSFAYLGDITTPAFLAIPAILTLILPLLWMFDRTRKIASNKLVFQGALAISAFFLVYTVYPWLFGKTLGITSLLNNSAMQNQIFYTTIIGGVILIALSLVFFRIFYKAGQNSPADVEESSH
ncbi:MAG: hypothetical protein B2I17_05175 [Thermoplasmatales archaeon B_DKE]|nr:MAG: hypothetical protein B2I17_05175 [Thermoplasmatales archaeon B_DKE]